MICREFLSQLDDTCEKLSILSYKNGAVIYRIRHRANDCDFVVRHYNVPVAAYHMLRSVRHNHIPEIFDAVCLDDGQIVIEEFIAGISVAEVLESGKYTYQGAKSVLISVCKAVETLHSMGVIHRDIKPENILISRDGTVKLIDLGASREPVLNKKKDTVILGTVGYAPPEQYGIGQSDSRADIYAIGVLLNVMLTGEHPSCCLVGGRAGRIVKKCTAIHPHNRFSSVRKLMMAL